MKAKRTAWEQHDKIQETLESYRRFDYDYLPFGTHWHIPDGDFPYKKAARCGVMSFILRACMATLGRVLTFVCYGAVTKGKKHLRALKGQGAICVVNHFSYLDTLFVRQAVGNFRSYHTMAPWNNKTGLGGWFIHRAGMLPFSPNLAATRNLNAEMERLLKNGKIINFYAEQAMWVNYQKPRPMKDGAFFYADKFSVPVLPVFCTFKKNKKGHMKHLRIHILPPVYADGTLPKRERIKKHRQDTENAWKQCYEEVYGIPLEYLPCRKKQTP